jgi:hypothetical protein
MQVELSKKDIIHLLRSVEPSYDKMRTVENMDLGTYTGGFDDSFDWNYQSSKCWDKYSEEDLFKLYKELTK